MSVILHNPLTYFPNNFFAKIREIQTGASREISIFMMKIPQIALVQIVGAIFFCIFEHVVNRTIRSARSACGAEVFVDIVSNCCQKSS